MDFFLEAAGWVFIGFIIYTFINALGLGKPYQFIESLGRSQQAKRRHKEIRLGLRPCPRCGGSGYIPEFQHVQDGICFLCWGYSPYGRYGTPEYRTRRFEAAVKARDKSPEPRPQYLEKRTRYYEQLSPDHLQGILDNLSESELQDDEIAVIKMVRKNKLHTR